MSHLVERRRLQPVTVHLRVGDVGPLVALSRRTISASYRPFLGDDAVDAFLDGGAADRFVEESLGLCWVVLRDGAVVGYAVCQANLIDLMMIDHAAHRQGLGSRLLGHVEAVLSQSHDELRLESFEANHNANAFYRKHVWLQVSRYLDQESGVHKVVFRKPAEPGDRPGPRK